jgi:hypothetical protein
MSNLHTSLYLGREGHDGTIRLSTHKNKGNCARNITITIIFLEISLKKQQNNL